MEKWHGCRTFGMVDGKVFIETRVVLKLVMWKPQVFGLWAGSSLPFLWDFDHWVDSGSAKFASYGRLGGYLCTFRRFYKWCLSLIFLGFRWVRLVQNLLQTGGPRLGFDTSLFKIIKWPATIFQNRSICQHKSW